VRQRTGPAASVSVTAMLEDKVRAPRTNSHEAPCIAGRLRGTAGARRAMREAHRDLGEGGHAAVASSGATPPAARRPVSTETLLVRGKLFAEGSRE
jgi:hypothetical protein